MFGTVLTILFTLMLVYVLWRAGSIPAIRRVVGLRGMVLCGVGVWGLFLLGRLWGHDGEGAGAGIAEFVGMSLLGWVFLTAFVLILVDLATLFGRLLPRLAPRLRVGGLILGAALSVFALFQAHRAPAVITHEVTIPGLPEALDGTVLVAMADAHLGSQLGDAWFSERLQEVAALDPDLVVFLGDMFEGHGAPLGEIPALQTLRPPLGAWFVEGNHDTPRAGREDRAAALEAGGFRRMVDTWASPAPGLVIAGVRDITRHQRHDAGRDPIGDALAGRAPGAVILLSHSPLEVERAAAAGVSLMLSGHTHGGQLWPFGALVGLRYPYLSGRYDVGDMTLIVSRGVGTWGPRMRLWRRGEILRVVLRAEGNGH